MAELNGAAVVAVPMRRPVEAIAPAGDDAVLDPVHVEVQSAAVPRQQLQPGQRRRDVSRDIGGGVPEKTIDCIWGAPTGREPVAQDLGSAMVLGVVPRVKV